MFEGLQQMPAAGWRSVTVPGAVSSWVALSRRFGVLPFEELFAPAIGYAERGFPVSPFVARTWKEMGEKYRGFPSFVETFLPGGTAPATGDLFRYDALGSTLGEIAETYGESFYRGRLARAIAAFSRETGGLLCEDDLASHAPEWVESVSVDFGDYTLHEMPPNSQGIAALIALALLRDEGISKLHPDSLKSVELQLKAMFVALTDVRAHVTDPVHMDCDAAWMLSAQHLSDLRGVMHEWPESQLNRSGGTSGGDTVFLTAADSSGMMVSLIQSNYFDFGSGLVVPGTGISLHSRAALFDVDPEHPNVVAGGKRPFHTLSPAFLSSHGRPVMSFGVMGGPMQPQGHVQTLLRLCTQGQNPQAACDAPRWHVTAAGEVMLEDGFSESVYGGLREHGYRVQRLDYGDPVFGGGQFILRTEGGYCAASDPRRDGQAVAF